MTPLMLGLIVLASAALCALLIVVTLPLLRAYALARPNARSSHTIPTPQGAGAALIVATLVVSWIAVSWVALSWVAVYWIAAGAMPPADMSQFGVVTAAALLLGLIGAIDDVHGLGAAPRLLLQCLLVGLVIAALPDDVRIVPAISWWLERAALVVAGVWFVNLTNFMDGIDWMTVAEIVPVTAGLGLIGLWLDALPAVAVILTLALLGAMIGFAPFNRPVARMFLGDVGSLPIGLLTGWLLLLLASRGYLAAAILLPLYYLADSTVTLIRRLRAGETIWQAHRSHFYQRATTGGFTVLGTVTRVFVLNLGLLGLAVWTVAAGSGAVDLAALSVGAAAVGYVLVRFDRGKV